MLPPELLVSLLERAEIGVAVVDAHCRFRYVNERMAAINGAAAADHLGRPVAEVLPDLADRLHEIIGGVIATQEPLLSVMVEGVTPAGSERRTWEASYLPIRLEGEPAVAVVATDQSERHEATTHIRWRLGQQAALADLGQRALLERDLDAVLHAGTAMLADQLETERAGVLERVPNLDHLVMRAGVGFPAGAVGHMTAEFGPRSQAGQVAREAARWIGPFSDSFPDFRMEVVDVIAEPGKVAACFKCSGTQLGEWQGRPPSGRRFEGIDKVYVFEVRDGRLFRAITVVEDNLTRMRQLGLVD